VTVNVKGSVIQSDTVDAETWMTRKSLDRELRSILRTTRIGKRRGIGTEVSENMCMDSGLCMWRLRLIGGRAKILGHPMLFLHTLSHGLV